MSDSNEGTKSSAVTISDPIPRCSTVSEHVTTSSATRGRSSGTTSIEVFEGGGLPVASSDQPFFLFPSIERSLSALMKLNRLGKNPTACPHRKVPNRLRSSRMEKEWMKSEAHRHPDGMRR